MKRWVVVFRSHAEGLSDEHFVGVRARSEIGAIREALKEAPPPHAWVFAAAKLWPRGADMNRAVSAFG